MAQVKKSNTHEIVNNEKGKYVVYKLYVSTAYSNWFLIRRYSEFYALWEVLKKKYPDANLKIPPKKWFGNFSQSTIDDRIKGLNELVKQIVSIPGVFSEPAVQEFFRTEDPKNKVPEEEELEAEENAAAGGGGGDEYTNDELGSTWNKKATPEDFHFTKVIGKGSFGRVFLAQHKESNKYYAIKVLAKAKLKSDKEKNHLMSERNVLLNNIKHPFLVALHYSFQNSTKLYFVLDYVNGGELFYHLQKEKHFDEYRSKFYAAEIACALGYLHSRHIIYRDLKPENLLLDRFGHIIITDFGLAKERMDQQAEGKTGTFCGTPEYLAPEVLLKKPYTYALDWWCLGSVLYEMIFGAPPFYCRDHMTMYDRIKNKTLEFGKAPITAEGKSVLTQMLQKDPDNRLGTKNDLDDIRSHPFFKPLDFDKLEKREIAPPYKPNVSSEYDTSNIDREFLRSPVGQSVGKTEILAGVKAMDDNFDGFTYAPPTNLGANDEDE